MYKDFYCVMQDFTVNTRFICNCSSISVISHVSHMFLTTYFFSELPALTDLSTVDGLRLFVRSWDTPVLKAQSMPRREILPMWALARLHLKALLVVQVVQTTWLNVTKIEILSVAMTRMSM